MLLYEYWAIVKKLEKYSKTKWNKDDKQTQMMLTTEFWLMMMIFGDWWRWLKHWLIKQIIKIEIIGEI